MGKKKKSKKLGSGPAPISGSQRSLQLGIGSIRRRYDLEIQENPIRDPGIARELIEMREWCYEARHCLAIASDDTFASSDGDDQGWTIAETLDDEETPVNPEVYAIALDLIERRESHEQFVIGGDRLKRALRTGLGYGDCFLELGIEKEGIGRNDYGVAKTLYLPTWEMFRKETDQGQLEGFEQRRYLSAIADADYFFYPFQIIHFRYEQQYLYGESIFRQSLDKWGKLKEAVENLADGARDLGVNPNLHIMPEGAGADYRDNYRNENESLKQQGIIPDYYLASGADIRKMSNINPSLQPLIDTLLQWRYYVIPPGFPVYFFPGLQTTGAREISQEPSKRYSRMRYSWCQFLTKGIRQVVDTEIILKKGYQWWHENAKYRIVFPEWQVDNMVDENDGSNPEGMTDLDTNNSQFTIHNSQLNNGNGSKEWIKVI